MRGESYVSGTNEHRTLRSLLVKIASHARDLLETSRELLDNDDPDPME